MYKLCRLMLIATVLVVCESLVAFATSAGGLGYLGIAIFLIASLAKRGYGRLGLRDHGSAILNGGSDRWVRLCA